MNDIDVFFLSEYGKLYDNVDKGVCTKFIFSNNSGSIQNMVIKRPVPWVIDGIQFYDVTTPYGYGGPVITAGNASSDLISDYYDAWNKYCENERIIAEFIRFHLFDNEALKNAFPGKVNHVTDNVVRKLDISLDEMWMEFERKVRKNIKRARNNSLFVTTDVTGEHLDTFISIYYKTMKRNGAKRYYYFDMSYFKQIVESLKNHFMFFHVWKDDVIISTELVLYSDRYVYSFLGGTLAEYYLERPNDLLKYEIIKWAKETNHKYFILGGGYGANDGIYRYKKAFAPGADVPFFIGTRIINEVVYSRLAEIKKKEGGGDNSFFPVYRTR